MAKKGVNKKEPTKKATKQKTSKRKTKETPEATQTEQINWRKWLGTLSKGSFFALAVTYITGFLVVTVHFSQMGLPPPLSPSKYLIAGFFPLLTLALVAFALLQSIKQNIEFKESGKIVNSIWLAVIFINTYYFLVFNLGGSLNRAKLGTPIGYPYITWITIGAFICGILLTIIISVLKNRFGKKTMVSLLIILTILASVFSLSIALHFAKEAFWGSISWLAFTFFLTLLFNKKNREEIPHLKGPSSMVYTIILAVAWLTTYSLWVYPKIPTLFGGGQTSDVVVWSQTHPLYPNSPLYPDSFKAELINKTGNEYLLRIEDSLGEKHIVEIGKDKVESIIYLSPKQIKARQAKADSLKEVEKDTTTTDTLPPAPDSS